MGYFRVNGRYADSYLSTFSNGVVTATTTSPGHELGDRGTMRVDLTVTAATGSPNLVVAVETSKDNITWVANASFTAVTGVGTTRKIFTGLDRWVRTVGTFTGTGSLTRSVIGESV